MLSQMYRDMDKGICCVFWISQKGNELFVKLKYEVRNEMCWFMAMSDDKWLIVVFWQWWDCYWEFNSWMPFKPKTQCSEWIAHCVFKSSLYYCMDHWLHFKHSHKKNKIFLTKPVKNIPVVTYKTFWTKHRNAWFCEWHETNTVYI